MKLILVSGLSGAGKSVALHKLEDLGYYCVDNIPAALLRSFVELTMASGDVMYRRVAVGVDARNRAADIDSLPHLVNQLRSDGINCEVVFLNADENVLVKRYGETRRRHPLSGSGSSLRDALAGEKTLLVPISEAADIVIDTSSMSVHDLREMIEDRIEGDGTGSETPRFSLLFESFGFKHGIPDNADFVFDVRCLPNPYWEAALRPGTGLDEPVAKFLEGHAMVERMISDIARFIQEWLPPISVADRSYLTVAIGCTGGRHRSVYVVEQLAEKFRREYPQLLVRHSALPAP
ncbi:MAG: RNase adapter RapZ [Gammaproteobacteria bacterium]|nr:RNase adapter RapZ [Gammaproteobacteria bacterium]